MQQQLRKGVHQGCILSPCLLNLYAEYIMQNAKLDEAQAGIKIAGTNISNLRYADDTPLIAQSEEEQNSLLNPSDMHWKIVFHHSLPPLSEKEIIPSLKFHRNFRLKR